MARELRDTLMAFHFSGNIALERGKVQQIREKEEYVPDNRVNRVASLEKSTNNKKLNIKWGGGECSFSHSPINNYKV